MFRSSWVANLVPVGVGAPGSVVPVPMPPLIPLPVHAPVAPIPPVPPVLAPPVPVLPRLLVLPLQQVIMSPPDQGELLELEAIPYLHRGVRSGGGGTGWVEVVGVPHHVLLVGPIWGSTSQASPGSPCHGGAGVGSGGGD